MTIDQLRERRRELLGRKQYELELQAKGEGDNLALFMVEEELLDINAQLRSLRPGHRVGQRRSAGGDIAIDHQQYQDWAQQDQSADDEGTRSAMIRAAPQSLALLPRRQREIWDLRQAGLTMKEIARRLGINKSTVSRLLSRARRTMGEDIRQTAALSRIDLSRVDMADRETAQLVLAAVTPRQAAYLYLYYAEWLTLREIERLTGTNYTAVCRTIQRGLRNISGALGCQEAVLVNMEALDELAYSVYRELQEEDVVVPPALRPARVRGSKDGRSYQQEAVTVPAGLTICGAGGRWSWAEGRQGSRPLQRGRLYTALLQRMRRAEGPPVYRWLVTVFQRLTGRFRRGAVRRWKQEQREERSTKQ